ncbi:uncharacterized protein LOC127701356 [Mytilus californianus]|uniref:uncharacterized protein LOC127701356 n=1 Tax=Mytilus californianus TaxID=6549 RepID=UPI0022457BCE|nr:uncharacterized protein LOC127701356 [Mytilus californianus]
MEIDSVEWFDGKVCYLDEVFVHIPSESHEQYEDNSDSHGFREKRGKLNRNVSTTLNKLGNSVQVPERYCSPSNQCNIPGRIDLKQTIYHFHTGSPTQTDIEWMPPENSNLFQNLTYELELGKNGVRTRLTNRRVPVIRIYTTDSKALLDKHCWSFQKSETNSCDLFVRAVNILHATKLNAGPWSHAIKLTFNLTT